MYRAKRGIRSYQKSSSSNEELEKARQHRALVEEYGSLVRKVAQRILRRLPPYIRGLELEDLVSVGVMGLLDAHERFDPSEGKPFGTFAEFRIKGAILDSLRKHDFFPRRLRQKANKLQKAEKKLESNLGRAPEPAELAAEMEMDLQELQELRGKVAPYSFVDEADVSFSLTAPTPDPFRLVNYKETREQLVDCLKGLSERKQLVLDLYFNKELTLAEIGDILDLTPGRVSQLKSAAIKELRGVMAG
ncbi:FliA/WhiG family RNA polymerase sigma factor [Persicimonas caeni]|uniref:FliA/WhiG family RNA polymerase sigma factor n=1 Tax=Persicimonas caeni TaxID=2292766 RepID=A0A4Y6PSP9_PERCE|nr:FliA/WhiG family RNA polymerase sigma factor [Persicimonas caeni]QDG51356.1 FliA/WhiG family RNA polymerase sigma factor [Persicimonas caeni]QED32577.1 FliA/WhiG family RNA polymerase sigma factor [Persicimonas caeni]